jgi:hypothetical protein
MPTTTIGHPDHIAQAQDYQARRMAFAQRGDLDGLVRELYSADARLHGFDFRAEGRDAIKGVIGLMGKRLAGLGPVQVRQLIAGRDFIWQELLIDSQTGPIEPYEVKFLRHGQVWLQLYGSKQGTVWQPGDFAGFVPPPTQAAEQVHHRYIDYQARQDADGMADEFFGAEGRLVTAKLNIEGREALRQFFRSKFEKESGFHLVSTRNLTGDHDYVWFEATAGGSQGVRTVYDVMLLRDGQVTLQLVGTLEGVLPANEETLRVSVR